MEQTRWWLYVRRLIDAAGWSAADLSRASGVDQSVIGRWEKRGATPEPRTVRAVAKALDRDVREAAIEAGHYTAEELDAADAPIDPYTVDLSLVPNDRILDEVRARMDYQGPRPGPRNAPRGNPPVSAAASDSTGVPINDGHSVTPFRSEPLFSPESDKPANSEPGESESESESSVNNSQ